MRPMDHSLGVFEQVMKIHSIIMYQYYYQVFFLLIVFFFVFLQVKLDTEDAKTFLFSLPGGVVLSLSLACNFMCCTSLFM